MKNILVFILAGMACFNTNGQTHITLDQAIDRSVTNNLRMRAASLDIDYQQQIKRTSTDVSKTNIALTYGQYNSYIKRDNNVTVTQKIPFPTVFPSQNTLGRSLVKGSVLKKAATENELVFQVKQVYYQLLYLTSKAALLRRQDSIYNSFVRAADLRYRTGETRLLEKTTAVTRQSEARNALARTQGDIRIYEKMLQTLMNSGDPVSVTLTPFGERPLTFPLDSAAVNRNPQLAILNQQIEIASAEKKVAGAKLLPDITIGYFSQTLIGTRASENGSLATGSDRFQGFQVGVSIPIWFGPQTAKVKAADIQIQRTKALYEDNKRQMEGQWQQAVQEYIKNKSSVDYYQSSALQNAELMLTQSELAFRNGEIDYTEYWLAVQNGIRIRDNYLQTLNDLNQSIITLEFLAGTY